MSDSAPPPSPPSPPAPRPGITRSVAERAKKLMADARMMLGTRSSALAAVKPGAAKDKGPSQSVVQRARKLMDDVGERLRGGRPAAAKAPESAKKAAPANPGGVAAGVVQPGSADFPLWTSRVATGYPGAEPAVPGTPEHSAYAAQVNALLDGKKGWTGRSARRILDELMQALVPAPDARLHKAGGIQDPEYIAAQAAYSAERKVALDMFVRRYAATVRAGRPPGDALLEGLLASLLHMHAFQEAYLAPLKRVGAVPLAESWPSGAELRSRVMAALMDAGVVDIAGHVTGRHGYMD